MKAAFKFAALALLLVISIGNAMAAIPCQAELKNAMHCGTDCPMMATMPQAMGQSRADVNGTSCCQISSQPSTPAPVQILPERMASFVMVATDGGVTFVPFFQKAQSKIRQNDLRQIPNAPALLCTFLI